MSSFQPGAAGGRRPAPAAEHGTQQPDDVQPRFETSVTSAHRADGAETGRPDVAPATDLAPQDAPVPSASSRPGLPITPALGAGGRAKRLGDRIFKGGAGGAAIALFIILVAIAGFLVGKAVPALRADSVDFLTTKDWFPDNQPSVFGIAALVYGTVVTSLIAVFIAVPVAIGVALAVTQYLPRRVAAPIGYLVDLLAAVPSVVYGLWGLFYLVPNIAGLSKWLSTYFGWIPIFASDGIYGKSIFTAGIVLAIMILPIVAAISREVFAQTPQANKEAAYALGATKWEMVRTAVLPYGRPGLISAVVLGFGRAMGETIAVALVLSANYTTSLHWLTPGGNTIAANIANTFGDAGNIGKGALIASGLVLFVITLIVNMTARAIVARRKDFYGAAL